jgi:hypothetical protein
VLNGVNYKILKNLHPNTKTELLSLYNYLWTKRCLPKIWREAIVVPITKQGLPKDNPLSFTPIALTNTMCKVMEKMVKERLMWKLEYDEIDELLCEKQSGFRRGRSGTDNLLILKGMISESFAGKWPTFIAL